MREHNVIQLSPAWWELKRGRPTASDFDRILSPGKGEPSKQATAYMGELLRSTSPLFEPGAMTEKPSHPAMRHGVDCEPEARAFYEQFYGVRLRQTGLCTTDCGRFGMSPDALEAVEHPTICVEIKCPQPETHFKYREDGVLPTAYRCQCHGQLIVGEGVLTRVDFLSYCPPQPPLLVPVYWDDFTDRLKAALEAFWADYTLLLSGVYGRPVRTWADVDALIRRAA